jgi:hypothetical protein
MEMMLEDGTDDGEASLGLSQNEFEGYWAFAVFRE